MKNFTVLMSVYKHEKPEHLRECFDSIILQTRTANEVILVIDGEIGSNLREIIDFYQPKLNMKILPLTSHVGLAKALNEGLKISSYDLILRMDTDDVCLPDRFESQLSFMEKNPEIVVSSGFIEEWDSKMENIITTKKVPNGHQDIINFSKKRNPINHPAVCFRRKIIMCYGSYPNVYPEDFMLWLKLLMNGKKFGNLDKVLVKMRTGKDFYKRRGLKFLKGEILIHVYMYKNNWCSFFELIYAVTARTIIRLAPRWARPLAYKYLR